MLMTTLEGLVELIASVRARGAELLRPAPQQGEFQDPSRLDRDGGAPSRCVHEKGRFEVVK